MIRESGVPKHKTTRRRGPKKTAALNAPLEQFASLARDVARNLRVKEKDLILTEQFLGKIYQTSAYPLYSDARYEVQRSRPTWTLDTNDALTVEKDQYPYSQQQIVIATNLTEILSGSHSVSVDQPVHVFGVVVPKNPRVVHYFFSHGGGDEGWVVKPNFTCPRGGVYFGVGYRSDALNLECATPGTPLNMPEGMVAASPAPGTVLIANLEENGLDTHWLEMNTWTHGVRRGTDDLGFPIIMVVGGYYKTGSALGLGEPGMKDSFVPSASGDPDGSLWQRDTTDSAAYLWVVTGFRQDPGSSGDCEHTPPKLWMYKRQVRLDAGGKLTVLSTEIGSVVAVGCCPQSNSISSPTFASADEAVASAAIFNRIAIASVAA